MAAEEVQQQQSTCSYQDLEGDRGLPGYTGSTDGPSLAPLALLEDDDTIKDGGSDTLLSGGLFSWTTHTRSTSSVSSCSTGSFSTPRETQEAKAVSPPPPSSSSSLSSSTIAKAAARGADNKALIKELRAIVDVATGGYGRVAAAEMDADNCCSSSPAGSHPAPATLATQQPQKEGNTRFYPSKNVPITIEVSIETGKVCDVSLGGERGGGIGGGRTEGMRVSGGWAALGHSRRSGGGSGSTTLACYAGGGGLCGEWRSPLTTAGYSGGRGRDRYRGDGGSRLSRSCSSNKQRQRQRPSPSAHHTDGDSSSILRRHLDKGSQLKNPYRVEWIWPKPDAKSSGQDGDRQKNALRLSECLHHRAASYRAPPFPALPGPSPCSSVAASMCLRVDDAKAPQEQQREEEEEDAALSASSCSNGVANVASSSSSSTAGGSMADHFARLTGQGGGTACGDHGAGARRAQFSAAVMAARQVAAARLAAARSSSSSSSSSSGHEDTAQQHQRMRLVTRDTYNARPPTKQGSSIRHDRVSEASASSVRTAAVRRSATEPMDEPNTLEEEEEERAAAVKVGLMRHRAGMVQFRAKRRGARPSSYVAGSANRNAGGDRGGGTALALPSRLLASPSEEVSEEEEEDFGTESAAGVGVVDGVGSAEHLVEDKKLEERVVDGSGETGGGDDDGGVIVAGANDTEPDSRIRVCWKMLLQWLVPEPLSGGGGGGSALSFREQEGGGAQAALVVTPARHRRGHLSSGVGTPSPPPPAVLAVHASLRECGLVGCVFGDDTLVEHGRRDEEDADEEDQSNIPFTLVLSPNDRYSLRPSLLRRRSSLSPGPATHVHEVQDQVYHHYCHHQRQEYGAVCPNKVPHSRRPPRPVSSCSTPASSVSVKAAVEPHVTAANAAAAAAAEAAAAVETAAEAAVAACAVAKRERESLRVASASKVTNTSATMTATTATTTTTVPVC